jgi:hypothetical protein
MPCEPCEKKGAQKKRRMLPLSACEMFMSVLLHTYLLDKKSVIGDDTSSFGLTMLCSRRSKPRSLHFHTQFVLSDNLLKDYDRARQVYRTALNLVPHKQFTFAKLWIMAARFEVRQLDLMAARKMLGSAIGMCPKEALLKGYIQLEMDV